ncbi:adenine nucleotide alpha hydrolase family protein [Xinfangfangia pollutisoli]|uniref:hypothetical protein n=1 Tax=Xinfangfangia pollutisoli TaxID=2865960 RepID=UPI001CD2A923|nr:hypothetical protein [Xinfangfangia pollutisoli]
MNKFAFVAVGRSAVSDEQMQAIAASTFAAAPFHIGKKLILRTSAGILVSASAQKTPLPDMDYTHVDGDDFLVFDGIPVFKGQNLQIPWAKRLFVKLKSEGIGEFFKTTMGDFCLCAKIGGKVFAFGDFSGLCPIFFSKSGERPVISNRQRLTQQLATGQKRASLDAETCAMLTGQANLFGQKSIYSGVEIIGPSRFVTITDGTLTQGGFRRFYGQAQRELTVEDGREAARAIIAQAQLFNDLPFTDLEADLTGGMDSRAVLGLAVKSGLADRIKAFRTYGSKDLPDLEVASALARHMGLPHMHMAPPPAPPPTPERRNDSAESFWKRLRYSATVFDGAVSADIGIGSPPHDVRLCLSGSGGEMFRPHIKQRRLDNITTLEDLLQMVARYQRPMDPLSTHKDSVNADLVAQMQRLARWYVNQNVPFEDVNYLFYLEHRLPWWAGYSLANIGGRRRLFPLVSLRAAEIMYQGSPELKKIDWLHFVLMKECDPRLVCFPFLDNQWDERLRPFAEGLPIATAPYPLIDRKDVVGENWMLDFAEQDWENLFAYVLDAPQSMIFDFVDRQKLEARRNAKNPWGRRIASISALLSLITFRMIETDDTLPALQL